MPTGHHEMPNGHYDTLNEQLNLSTRHSSAQGNNHGLDNPLNVTANTGTSSGKQRLGPALSARFSADANDVDALSIHANDSEDDEIPLDKAVADLLTQAQDVTEPRDTQGLLETLAQALEAPSDVSDPISPQVTEIFNSHWGKCLPPKN